MAIHERYIDDPDDHHGASPWPNPCDDSEFTPGCPGCDAARIMLALEAELRMCSLDLWVAGWTPTDLLDEVRSASGSTGARDFMVQVLLVDDSHRSEQARNTPWNDAIASLRAMTGQTDVSAGWLGRWLLNHETTSSTERDVAMTLETMLDLLEPLATTRPGRSEQ
jgi:hypothetical protein